MAPCSFEKNILFIVKHNGKCARRTFFHLFNNSFRTGSIRIYPYPNFWIKDFGQLNKTKPIMLT